jgi:hypothetical protein
MFHSDYLSGHIGRPELRDGFGVDDGGSFLRAISGKSVDIRVSID